MKNLSESQSFDNSVLFQRIELIFKRADCWPECAMPLLNEEMIEKVLEEQGVWFDHNPALIVTVMEELEFKFSLNEHNQKRYWLVNPA